MPCKEYQKQLPNFPILVDRRLLSYDEKQYIFVTTDKGILSESEYLFGISLFNTKL